MSMSRPPRFILHRGVLFALGILVALLVVGSPDHASAQADTRPKWVHDGTFTVLDLVQEYTVGVAVDVTLPAATGDGTLTYSLTPEQGATLPAGVTFNASTRKLTGVPTRAQALTGYKYTVTDADGDTAKFDIAIVVLEAPPVQEQVLVSNIGKGSPQSFEHNQDRAQGFTTGAGGYIVTSVELPMGKDPGTAPTFTVAIHADSNGQPGSKLATLTAPETIAEGINTFTHTGVGLAPATSYFVVIDVSARGTAFATFVNFIRSDEEDGTAGWTIGDDGHYRSFGSLDSYSSDPASLVMRINGTVTTPSVALVSNTDETAQDIQLSNDNAQGFTTGGGGYILTSVDLDMVREATGTAPTFTVAVHADSNGQPGDSLATLTAPPALATGLNRFTHTGLALASSTSYFVVIDVSATGTAYRTYVRTTSSNDEDSTVGWTIGNDGHYRTYNSTGTYSSGASSLVMRINGTLADLAGLTVKPVAGKTTELAVSWTAQGGAEQYRVQHKTATSAYSSGTTVTTNSHTITGLTADTTYTVQVTAVDTDADPDADLASDQAVATTPDEMGAISVSAVAGSSTELSPSWADINGETGYLVQWKTGGEEFSDTERRHTTAANVTSARISGLSASTVYTVRVTARVSIDGQAADGDSAEGSGTTNAPSASPGVLVSNTGNARRNYETLGGADAAQGFTTGGNATGYTLTSVDLILRGIPAGTRSDGLEVFIAAESTLGGRPGKALAILTNPDTLSSGGNTFTHPGLHLEPDTTYYVIIDVVCRAYTHRNGVRLTLSHAETGAAGWSIADGRRIQRYSVNHRRHGGSWPAEPSSNVLFSVNGVANAQLAPRQHSLFDDVLRVLWTPSTEPGVTGYLVQWKTGAQSYSTLERSHTAGSEVSSHEVSGLALGVHTVRLTQQGGASDGHAQEATVTLHGWPGVVYLDPVAGDARAADVEWETVSTAAGYVIELKPVTFDTCGTSSRRTVTADNMTTYRTYTLPYYTGEPLKSPVLRVTGLQPNTEYEARVIAYTAAGSASAPDGLSHASYGATFGEITGLSVSAADRETTKLNVRWTAPTLRSDGYTVRGYRVEWKTGAGDYTDTNSATVSSGTTAYQVTGLEAETAYTVKVTVLSNWLGNHEDGDSAEASGTTNAPNETGQGQSPPEGVGTAALAGLTVTSVSGQPSQLAVNWDEVQGAARYDVRWKTGAGDYGDAQQATTNSYTITGLSPNTTYTVNVAALDAENSLLAEGTASGTTDQQQSDETPAVSFVVYHDPNAGDAAVDRYNQAVKLLIDAEIEYTVVRGAVQDDVDRLAGVIDSVLPRFFLGDPTEEGWVSQPGENNGGLRWLREKTSEMSGATAYAPAEPAEMEGLTVNPVSGETTRLAVSWKAVTDADRYLVRWKTGSGSYNIGEGATNTSHTVTGLTADTAYTVQVTAIDTEADPDAELAVGEASGTTLAAMGAVTVSAVADSSDSLDVSWPAVSGAVGYVVEWKTGSSSYTAVTRSDATATSERITGLVAETAYTVKVTARHTIAGLEAKGDSAEGSGTTNAAPAQEPLANSPASGAPTISGTAQVGETLTLATSGISDADGLANASFSYQWLADGANISGATGSSYTPVAADVGKAIKVTVSFTDDAGNAETLTSAATAAVAAANTPASEPAVSFVIYHDPDAGDDAVDRYNQGVKLLKDAGIKYSEVKGDVQDDVDRLAGVTGSVIPRFFLGDPTDEDWVSETKVNNGGLRWLKEKVAELSGD